MTKKLFPGTLVTVLGAAVLGAALAAPAHADDRWTATDTAACAADLAVRVADKAVSTLPLKGAPAACGKRSLIQRGH
ncbi:hypothetical protein [Streptomyces sp. NPDC046727]|uniref:hypothetical protein n=1 Tax=Streptomyces sp. NPDC046727 TaxID=3155373 RepID=UPI0034071157